MADLAKAEEFLDEAIELLDKEEMNQAKAKLLAILDLLGDIETGEYEPEAYMAGSTHGMLAKVFSTLYNNDPESAESKEYTEKAAEHFEKSLTLLNGMRDDEPDYIIDFTTATVLCSCGDFLNAIDKTDDAEQKYLSAIKLLKLCQDNKDEDEDPDPKLTECYFNLAILYYENKRYKEAMQYFTLAKKYAREMAERYPDDIFGEMLDEIRQVLESAMMLDIHKDFTEEDGE